MKFILTSRFIFIWGGGSISFARERLSSEIDLLLPDLTKNFCPTKISEKHRSLTKDSFGNYIQYDDTHVVFLRDKFFSLSTIHVGHSIAWSYVSLRESCYTPQALIQKLKKRSLVPNLLVIRLRCNAIPL